MGRCTTTPAMQYPPQQPSNNSNNNKSPTVSPSARIPSPSTVSNASSDRRARQNTYLGDTPSAYLSFPSYPLTDYDANLIILFPHSGWALCLCVTTTLDCIPFCVGRLKNVEHGCGNCDRRLATWHRWGEKVDVNACH